MDPAAAGLSDAAELAKVILGSVLYLGLALYMIYDAETLGEATGRIGHGSISGPTPSGMVRFAGCAMLALPAGIGAGALWWPLGVAVGIAVAIVLYRLAGRAWPL